VRRAAALPPRVVSDDGEAVSATAVIPALNEAVSIGAVLDAIPRQLVAEIIVVDGGSCDETAAIAADRGAHVVVEPRRGYGRACAAGVGRARGDVIVFLDADGAVNPREIPKLLALIVRDRADMVLGSRLAGSIARGAMPWHQRFGNGLCAWLIRVLYRCPVTDLAPFRAVRRARLKEIVLRDQGYGWPTEMIVEAARAGWRIREVPVSCEARTGGRSKISGTARGTALATLHIFRAIVGPAG
jgi:glycosyltransferase involved in cell wall biosynthesis